MGENMYGDSMRAAMAADERAIKQVFVLRWRATYTNMMPEDYL